MAMDMFSASVRANIWPSETLFEVRAGKMLKDGKIIKPDARKGLIRLVRASDFRLSFQWHERNTYGVAIKKEDDFYIYPDEAEFKKIDRPNARIYCLAFREQPHRDMLFWAQEPDASQDEQICNKINTVINPKEIHPRQSLSLNQGRKADTTVETQNAAGPSDAAGRSDAADASSIGDFNVSQILRNLGMPNAATPQQPFDPQAAAAAAAILSAAAGGPSAPKGPSLSELLNQQVMLQTLQDTAAAARLYPYLPEQHRSMQHLLQTVSSAQLRQQLDGLSGMLQSGQLDLSQFGINPQGYSVQDFLNSIQEHVDKELSERDQSEDKDTQMQE